MFEPLETNEQFKTQNTCIWKFNEEFLSTENNHTVFANEVNYVILFLSTNLEYGGPKRVILSVPRPLHLYFDYIFLHFGSYKK